MACVIFVGWRLLSVLCCLLFVAACRWLFAVSCLSNAVRVDCCVLIVVCCLSFGVSCALLLFVV